MAKGKKKALEAVPLPFEIKGNPLYYQSGAKKGQLKPQKRTLAIPDYKEEYKKKGITKGKYEEIAKEATEAYQFESKVFANEGETLEEYVNRQLNEAIKMMDSYYDIELEIKQIEDYFNGKQYLSFYTNIVGEKSKKEFGRRKSFDFVVSDLFFYHNSIEPLPFLLFINFRIYPSRKRIEYRLDRRTNEPENVTENEQSYEFEDIYGNHGYLGQELKGERKTGQKIYRK